MGSTPKPFSADSPRVLYHHTEDGSWQGINPAFEQPATRLPCIPSVATGSFVNLFNHFSASNGTNKHSVPTPTEHFTWSPLVTSTASLQSSDAMPIDRTGIVARNDSTGSSSRTSTSLASSIPAITRNSSYSSIEGDSPIPPPKDDDLPSWHYEDATTGSSALFKHLPRTSLLDFDAMRDLRTPDLHKPLPSEPHCVKTKLFAGTENSAMAQRRSDFPTTNKAQSQGAIRRRRRSTTLNNGGLSEQKFAAVSNAEHRSHEGPKQRPRSYSTTTAELPASLPSTAARPLAPCRRVKIPSSRVVVTAQTAEAVIFTIMSHIEDSRDLASVAMVSKGFFNIFQRNESELVSRLVHKESSPAWQTRRSIMALSSFKDFRLIDYRRDVRTVKELKAAILHHCAALCTPKTIAGLQGLDMQNQIDVDNAIWRIWTFCALFGNNAALVKPMSAEMAWLNGMDAPPRGIMSASTGARVPLTSMQLQDMAEIWQCLQKLVSRFHGRFGEALQAGVLDEWNPSGGTSEDQHLLEWTSYLLTLGPQVVCAVSEASYEQVKLLGLTEWPLPPANHSRTRFLMAAISQVYQERLLSEATAGAAAVKLPPRQSRHRQTRSVDPESCLHRHPLWVDTKHRPPPSRPSHHHAGGHLRNQFSAGTIFPASPTTDPSFFHTLTMNRAASTRLGATLFPIAYSPKTPQIPLLPPLPVRAPPPASQVIDPTDRAINFLVHDMGFAEANVKRALAMTDTGSGVSVTRAMQLLNIDSTRRTSNTPIELPTPTDIVSPLRNFEAGQSSQKGRCNGSCNRLTQNGGYVVRQRDSAHRHTRSRSLPYVQVPFSCDSGANTPISPLTDIYGGHSTSSSGSSLEWQREAGSGDTIAALAQFGPGPSMRTSQPGSRHSNLKAWRVMGLGADILSPNTVDGGQVPGFGHGHNNTNGNKSNVVSMDEYLERVEKRRSMRATQEGFRAQETGSSVFGVPHARNFADLDATAGLGGLRPVTVERPEREREKLRKKEKEKDKQQQPQPQQTQKNDLNLWKSVMGTVRRDKASTRKRRSLAKEMMERGGERTYVG